MPANTVNKFRDQNTISSKKWEAVTASDSTDFSSGICRGLYVGTTGNVAAVMDDDTAITFVGVPAGVVLPIQARRVNSTNTTASNMVALF
mgnify:CR=1 FL=1